MAKLILIRGLPGSGKSTIAKKLASYHLEADMFFQRDGSYNYNRDQIKEAHAWCQNQMKFALQKGLDVVVSNTFVKVWELENYAKIAHKEGADIELIEANGSYENIHGIPAEIIDRMKNQWEHCKIIDNRFYKA